MVHLLGVYGTSYSIDLSDHNVTTNVMFKSEETDPPLVEFTSTSPTTGIRQLTISGLKVTGNIQIDAGDSTLGFVMTNTKAAYGRTVVNITGCRHLIARIARSEFTDALLAFSSEDTSNIAVTRSTFRGATSANATKSVGITVKCSERHGKHIIRLDRCLFENMQQNFGTDYPDAAFSLLTAKEKTRVKLYVIDSTFLNNSRAIDLSIKGDVFVLVTGSSFTGNVADGSGGAIRATATLRKGLGSVALIERAAINIVNCSFEGNTAVTSQRYDEDSVYFQVRPTS